MSYDANLYIHPADRNSLDRLKNIPGFNQLINTFMNIWDEDQYRIYNMASKIKLSEKQLGKYYNMLPPICEKLGIEVPELYLELNVNANSYTLGDNHPFIVITSGLLETFSDDLIPVVLAHECGHIACHHVLYRTLGDMLINDALSILDSELISKPIKMAFYYWIKNSEYSADRAAALCCGNEKVIEMCMTYAGYDKDIAATIDPELYLQQALEYKKLKKNTNTWNQSLELMMLSNSEHPLNAVRAYECNEWVKTKEYQNVFDDEKNTETLNLQGIKKIMLPQNAKYYRGKDYTKVEKYLRKLGFTNIKMIRNRTDKTLMTKDNDVLEIEINGNKEFSQYMTFFSDAPITITYYLYQTREELLALHPGEIQIPNSLSYYRGKDYKEVLEELKKAGFSNIMLESVLKKRNEYAVHDMSINGINKFNKGDWYKPNALIKIIYNRVN